MRKDTKRFSGLDLVAVNRETSPVKPFWQSPYQADDTDARASPSFQLMSPITLLPARASAWETVQAVEVAFDPNVHLEHFEG